MGEKIAYVAGGGGSPACYIHLGIIKELIHDNTEITDFIGTSAGSIVGAYYTFKMHRNGFITEDDITHLVSMELKGFKDLNLYGLAKSYFMKLFGRKTAINTLGLYKGKKLYKKLLEITDGITFGELECDVKLMITATEILTGSLIVFSKENTPNVKIADAVRASSGIQGAFVPYGIKLVDIIDGIYMDNSIKKRYVGMTDCDSEQFVAEDLLDMYGIEDNDKLFLVDGGNNGNCRTDICANVKSKESEMLAVSFTYNGKASEINLLTQLLSQTISVMMQATENLAIKYTQLKLPETKIVRPNTLNVDTTDFDLTYFKKLELMDEGVEAMYR